MSGLGFNVPATQKSYEDNRSLRQVMTSRQSAFFFFNSNPMMQNILFIDWLSITFGFGHYRLLSNFFPHSSIDKDQRPCALKWNILCLVMKINKSLLIPRFGKDVFFFIKKLSSSDWIVFFTDICQELTTELSHASFRHVFHCSSRKHRYRPCYHLWCAEILPLNQKIFKWLSSRRIHWYGCTRGGIPKFNAFHPNPHSNGWQGFFNKTPGLYCIALLSCLWRLRQCHYFYGVGIDLLRGNANAFPILFVKSKEYHEKISCKGRLWQYCTRIGSKRSFRS